MIDLTTKSEEWRRGWERSNRNEFLQDWQRRYYSEEFLAGYDCGEDFAQQGAEDLHRWRYGIEYPD